MNEREQSDRAAFSLLTPHEGAALADIRAPSTRPRSVGGREFLSELYKGCNQQR